MNSSETKAYRSIGVWRFAAMLALALAVGLYISHKITVLESVYWVGNSTDIKQEDGTWVNGHVLDVGHMDSIQELRFQVDVNTSEHWQEPVGLIVGGPFSAEFFWDGEPVGQKGQVGTSRKEEVAGPIDSVTFIPARLLEPGQHTLTIKLSTQHMNYDVKRIIHLVALGPYRQDERRSMRYYAAPILLLSGLLVLMAQSIRIGRSAGNRLYTGLGVFAGFVTLSLLTEVSRSVTSYPYDYHAIRGSFMWISSNLAGFSLWYLCFRLEQKRWIRYVLFVGLALVVLSHFFSIGGDRQIARNFLFLSAVPATVYTIQWFRGQASFMLMMPVFWLACFASNILSYGIFLDSYFFVASLTFLASAWFWTYTAPVANTVSEEPEIDQRAPTNFRVKDKGRETIIGAESVVVLHAEGNFTKLIKSDGSILLHQSRLGHIMDNPPPSFLRVHRSFAVNTRYVKALRSAEGSKYWLEMEGAEDVPVSRYRVAEIRNAIA